MTESGGGESRGFELRKQQKTRAGSVGAVAAAPFPVGPSLTQWQRNTGHRAFPPERLRELIASPGKENLSRDFSSVRRNTPLAAARHAMMLPALPKNPRATASSAFIVLQPPPPPPPPPQSSIPYNSPNPSHLAFLSADSQPAGTGMSAALADAVIAGHVRPLLPLPARRADDGAGGSDSDAGRARSAEHSSRRRCSVSTQDSSPEHPQLLPVSRSSASLHTSPKSLQRHSSPARVAARRARKVSFTEVGDDGAPHPSRPSSSALGHRPQPSMGFLRRSWPADGAL